MSPQFSADHIAEQLPSDSTPISPCPNCGLDPTEFDDEGTGETTWEDFYPECPWCYATIAPEIVEEIAHLYQERYNLLIAVQHLIERVRIVEHALVERGEPAERCPTLYAIYHLIPEAMAYAARESREWRRGFDPKVPLSDPPCRTWDYDPLHALHDAR